MKKYILFFVAIVFSLSMSAKKICIWREGAKVCELSVYANDSITFTTSDPSAQTMCIWRNGTKLRELGIHENDSITYSIVPQFDYDNWRDQTTIQLYFNNTWNTVKLPWADVAVTTMPHAYRFPNREYTHDTIPRWELAFNLCPDSTLEGVHMFGLWDRESSIMRIFSYLEEIPNPNAKYCYYYATSSHPAFVDRDAVTWMPSDSIIGNDNWNASAIPSSVAVPTKTTHQSMPHAGTINGQINRGWLCSDISFGCGEFNIPKDGSITLALYAVQALNLSGVTKFNFETLSASGKITIPSNKNKEAGGYVSAAGSVISSLTSIVVDMIAIGKKSPKAGTAAAWIGGIGAATSLIGDCFTNAGESADSIRSVGLNFNGVVQGEFTGQLSATLPTAISPVTMSYSTFFGDLLHHRALQAPQVRRTNSTSDSLSVGVWNLKNQPVLYVCNDGYLHPDYNEFALLSFLDPTSIELMINKRNPLFDADDIDSIKVIAYDFAFTDTTYKMPAQPYYNFYRIPQDSIPARGANPRIVGYPDYKEFLLDQSATPTLFCNGHMHYSGTSSEPLNEYGLGAYNIVYSPAIMPDTLYAKHSLALSEIGVAVIMEVVFKSGNRRIFAERFLPQIKAFSINDAQALRTKMIGAFPPYSLDGIIMDYPLFNLQKQKAIRMLNDEIYSMVVINPDPANYKVGFRVKSYQDPQHPGLVFSTAWDNPGTIYSCDRLNQLFSYMSSMGIISLFDEELDNNNMPTITSMSFVTSDSAHKYIVGTGCSTADYGRYILIYNEDANGNLTLVTE